MSLFDRVVKESEDKKVTQEEASYMLPTDKAKLDKPSGLFSCGNCVKFQAPNSCKTVEGPIFPGGCCNYFENPEQAKKSD